MSFCINWRRLALAFGAFIALLPSFQLGLAVWCGWRSCKICINSRHLGGTGLSDRRFAREALSQSVVRAFGPPLGASGVFAVPVYCPVSCVAG